MAKALPTATPEAEGLQTAVVLIAQLIAPSTTQGELPEGGLGIEIVLLPSNLATGSRFAALGAISWASKYRNLQGKLAEGFTRNRPTTYHRIYINAVVAKRAKRHWNPT